MPERLTGRFILTIPALAVGLIVLVACGALEGDAKPDVTRQDSVAASSTAVPLATAAATAEIINPETPTARVLECLTPSPDPDPARMETQSPELQPVEITLQPTDVVSSPESTPAPTAEAIVLPLNPEIRRLGVAPDVVDVGDTVILTWEGVGEWATLCPSARYELFTIDDCRQLAPSGEMAFTIPPEAAGFREIHFTLTVGSHSSSSTAMQGVSVLFKCHQTWFFSAQPQAGLCPLEPTRSHAAAQHFERGMMIWMEQLGRYYILNQNPLYEGEIRKQLSYVYDPLEIVADTSARVEAPPGLCAPVSGFGYVWRGDISASPGFRESLGWALAPEFGYEAILQCDDALPSGGRSWQTCYLRGPDARVIVLHPLGGWYLLGEE